MDEQKIEERKKEKKTVDRERKDRLTRVLEGGRIQKKKEGEVMKKNDKKKGKKRGQSMDSAVQPYSYIQLKNKKKDRKEVRGREMDKQTCIVGDQEAVQIEGKQQKTSIIDCGGVVIND